MIAVRFGIDNSIPLIQAPFLLILTIYVGYFTNYFVIYFQYEL